jgi:hypothetical protein
MRLVYSTIILFVVVGTTVSNGQSNNWSKRPEFNARDAAGIVFYDVDHVTRSLKLSDDSTIETVSKLLQEYNSEVLKISSLHASTFDELEKRFNQNLEIAIRQRDRSVMYDTKAEIQSVIPPIREEVDELKNILNTGMQEKLNADQYKNWLKYQDQKEPKAIK